MIEVITAKRMNEGEGVVVKRLFPIYGGRMNHDPFVLFDHFEIAKGQGFPAHPHRGFEAITYLFSGAMRHKDNLGNDSVIIAGGSQIFCAGRGISHSEMPESAGTTEGIQLWINLPKELKTIEPSYHSVDVDALPTLEFDGILVTTIAGAHSPVKLHNRATYQSVRVINQSTYTVNVVGKQGLIYVVSGQLSCGDQAIETGQALLFGDCVENLPLQAVSDCHFMVAYSAPHNEPIVQHGPFVD
jgi:hypothetical protein